MGYRTARVMQLANKHPRRRPVQETSKHSSGCVPLVALIADATRFRLHAYRTNTRLTKSGVRAGCQRRTEVACALLVRAFTTQEEIYQEKRCSVSSHCLKAG